MPDDADDEVIQVDTSSYRPKRSPRGSFSAPNSPAVRNIFRNPQDLLSPQTARLHSHHAVARRGGGFAHQITSRAMSEAGSILSESMETAAQAAADLVKVPLTMAMVGIACLLPLADVFIAPLILLFTPLLLSLGFGLTAFGLGRAGLIVTWGDNHRRRSAASSAPPPPPPLPLPIRRPVMTYRRRRSSSDRGPCMSSTSWRRSAASGSCGR